MERRTLLLGSLAIAIMTPTLGFAELRMVAASGAVHELEHLVDVGDGAHLHVVEKWSDAALSRESRRAIVFVTPTLVTSDVWNSDVPGDPSFNALDRAAERGFFAYAATWEGYPGSSQPADGKIVTAERMLAQMGVIVEWALDRSGAAYADLVAGSLGNSIAFMLGGAESPIDPSHIGRIVMMANVYRTGSPFLEHVLLSGAGCLQFEVAPDGYIDTPPPLYALILFNSELAAQLYAYQTFPGHYAVGPTLEGCELPVFDAALGRAPALLWGGPNDLLGWKPDMEQFCVEYGGPCEITYVEGAGHSPNFESVRDTFWDEAFLFFG